MVIALVVGIWGNWTEWSDCSVTCGIGTQNRSRECDSPAPEYSGLGCDGEAFDVQHCTKGECPGMFLQCLPKIHLSL